MTYLKVSYNQIPRLCTSIVATTFSLAAAPISLGPDDLPVQNLFYGGSTVYWRNSTSQAVGYAIFDLTIGSNYDAQTIDHIAIRGLNLMFKYGSGDIDIEVRGSTDGFVADDDVLLTVNNVTENDLVGPFLEDYILTGSLSTAYNQFRIKITATNEVPFRIRKINIGKLFDFGATSPHYPYTPEYLDNGSPFTADTGSAFKTSIGRRGRMLNFSWYHISEDDRMFFDKEIKKYLSDYPIFLYQPTVGQHNPLNEDTLLYGWAEGAVSSGEWNDFNDISLSFREDIVG